VRGLGFPQRRRIQN